MTGLLQLAEQVVGKLAEKGLFITAVESCTGGGLANCITNIEGASAVMKGAWVAYSNEAKFDVGVPPDVVGRHSAYSPETALAMARAGAEKLEAQVGVGITGQLSFPDPNLGNRVFIAVVFGALEKSAEVGFPAEQERWAAKETVVEKALRMVLEVLQETA